MLVTCITTLFGAGTGLEGPYTFLNLNASGITSGWNCCTIGLFVDDDEKSVLSDAESCFVPGNKKLL